TAAGVYSVGPHVGLVLAFGLGGWLAHTVGWRPTFAAAGALGLALAIVCRAKLRDPRVANISARTAGVTPPAPSAIVRDLMRDRAFRNLIAGATLATAGALGATTWLPALLTRAHGLTLAQAGAVLAIGLGIAGAAGTYAVGRIADRAARVDGRRK